LGEFGPIFRQVLVGGLDASAGTQPTLFSPDGEEDVLPPYEIGGLIHRLNAKVCVGFIAKGTLAMDVQWQVYSRAERKVIATIETTGSAEAPSGTPESQVIPTLTHGAFLRAAQALMQDGKFQDLLAHAPEGEKIAGETLKQERIALKTGAPAPRPLGEEAGSVVLIKAAGGFGSGVLVSMDGYILTDAHVVGLEKTVVLRWSDGLETEGKVIRLHKKRDVALIKADPHGRSPLPLRTTPLQVGDTIFAIGAPLFEQLQGTVTKGIVSAHRIEEGMTLIQTDMAINHGNSGGPVLDEKGYVVGLTEAGLQPGYGIQIGINYFTPIKDVLDFLSLDIPPAVGPAQVQKVSTPAAQPRPPRR
jgi:S1-C subfamily serine protease